MKFKEAIKDGIKGTRKDSDYSKLEMEDEDDGNLGLELGLGSTSLRKSNLPDVDSFDELKGLIMEY
jgi:hypothetical protein